MDNPYIREITILPGRSRSGEPERFEAITIRPGDTISIVGPTGSGKSAFINDIEVFARNDTATGRTVLVNGEYPAEEFVRDPAHKPVALITQNTQCLADLTVEEFLAMHVRSRKIEDEGIVGRTIDLANEFTGEAIQPDARMTALSGGQTRSLLVAAAVAVASAARAVEEGLIDPEKRVLLNITGGGYQRAAEDLDREVVEPFLRVVARAILDGNLRDEIQGWLAEQEAAAYA